MTRRLSYLALLVSAASGSTHAASYAVEARGFAMGGVGVVSASYLSAPFYNPALTAVYRRNDDVGMLLPGFGLAYEDPDDATSAFKSLADAIDNTDPTAAQQALDDLAGTEIRSDFGLAAAVALPNPYVSLNAFAKLYTESYVSPTVPSTGNTLTDADNTEINIVSIGVGEVGLTLAKYSYYLRQHIAIGISPKLQRLYTYAYGLKGSELSSFDSFDIGDNLTGETMFNMDFGSVWFYGPFRVGLTAMNLFSRNITSKEANSQTYTYQVKPQYTVGAGIVADYFTLSADYDLTEEPKFVDFDDNTQMFRAGVEFDVLHQLKIRAGYKKNMAYEDSEPTYTAGIGISPLGVNNLDLSVSYTNPTSKGAYINFLSTF